MTATTVIHLLKLVLIDLTIKSDSVLTNPIEKMGFEAGWCGETSTKAKEAPWGKTDPAGHQPSISMPQGNESELRK